MKFLYSKTSIKYLKVLGKKVARKLIESIENLPSEGDIKRLKGKKIKDISRLRVGKYRVIYLQEKDTIKIIKIDI
jgi:mRNA-degrading endonuclease RelE of RelBE toxin-antitoxin system